MIHELKPYSEYKHSGVPWLDIPTHWAVRRMKTLLRERVQKGFPEQPLLAATQSKGVVRKEQYENRTVLALKDLQLLKLVRPGDFVISLRSFQGGIEYAREEGIISPAYTIIYPIDPSLHGYLAWLFKSKPFIQNLSLYVTGIRQGQNIDYEKLGRSELPVPPVSEQLAIGRFLDHSDRRFRRYIRAKQRLIALLEERKQAIIDQALGLSNDSRSNGSGHWRRVRLKDVAAVQTGVTLGKRYVDQDLEYRPYLRVANVQFGRLDLGEVKTISLPPGEADGATLKDGDVLLTEGGDIDKLSRGCVWRGEIPGCVHQNHIFAVRCRQDVLVPDFLASMMASGHARAYFQRTAKQTTNLAATNSSTLRAFPFLLPPVSEQRAIVDTVSVQNSRIDSALKRVSDELALVHDFRARLIAAVVTGALDVRTAAVGLTDEIDGAQSLDETGLDGATDDSGQEVDATTEEVEA